MTAWPPLLVLTMATFFFSAVMGLALNEDREWRLEVVGYEKKGERERVKERGEEGEDDERERGGVGEREGGGSLE